MAELIWDQEGFRKFDHGVSKGILFLKEDDGSYSPGIPWNGIISITDSPQGGEENRIFADDLHYASLRAIESYQATIEAYTYPNEFHECDGFLSPSNGFYVHQGRRKKCALCWQSSIGDDAFQSSGTKIHIAYDLIANPSEKMYSTLSDSPDAMTYSWDLEGTGVNVFGYFATSKLMVDLSRLTHQQVRIVEDLLYGDAGATLPLPNDFLSLFSATGVLNQPRRQMCTQEIDYVSGDVLYRAVRTGVVLISGEEELPLLVDSCVPGTIAFTDCFVKTWQLNADRQWIPFRI